MNEELHHKMCKKVAQLTRVIFFLNTKNDEYEQNLKVIFHSKNIYRQQSEVMNKRQIKM